MKHLIVSCDGTWNTPDQQDAGRPAPTNVFKLHSCIAPIASGSIEQRTYYHPGVGTEGGLFTRALGGALGSGLSKNIMSAYQWLATHYEPGDLIYLIGFSRGAFTVRSLGGMLGTCGLLNLSGVPSSESWDRVKAAFEQGYREANREWAERDWPRFHSGAAVPIRFLGVWDTVGALGVPNDLAIFDLFDNPTRWQFHDTVLGDNVETARHALALDERRASFTPTLWSTEGSHDNDVKQTWFPGVHSDVGGGYGQAGLADAALEWMMAEARHAGLAFLPELADQVRPNPQDVLHDSLRGVFKKLRTRPRCTPPIVQRDDIHASALERQRVPPIAQAPYRPTRTLGPGESTTFDVFARERWNDPGLYLEPGSYRFEAHGEWVDKTITCGPAGTNDGNFQPGEIIHVAATAWGWIERGWRRVTGNEGADFVATRRLELKPWFCLIGTVANDAGGETGTDGSPNPHEEFAIGVAAEQQLTAGGYFYAFANDAWDFYGNNRGCVTLTVERTL